MTIIIILFILLVYLYWKKPFKKRLMKGRYIDIFNQATKDFMNTNTIQKRNYWIFKNWPRNNN